MIQTSARAFTLQPTDGLSVLDKMIGANRLYLDVETTSFDLFEYGNRPYAGHRICGFSVTRDDLQQAYYVPMRHAAANWNCDLEGVQRRLAAMISSCTEWVNHNVKFDAHFCAVEGAEFANCRLVDTITRAKLIDSDRMMRGGYGLDVLARDCLDHAIRPKEDEINKHLALYKKGQKKCHDYAQCPADIMGDYGCSDVLECRDLDIWQRRTKDPILNDIWETETLLTPILYDMEKKGLRVDPAKLEALEFSILTELQMIMAKINELTGLNIEPHKPADCFELLCSHFGLPVLGWTEAGNPSFDAEALSKYAVHPQVVFNEKRSLIIKLLERFRDRHTLLNFFVKPYIERNVKGYLHPTFNQVVQTGRMSAKEPNAHQLSKDAKELVIPEEGKAFLAFDMEQIEFRLIAHFIKDPAAIEAYAKDPSTDYHQFVAGICQIPRSPAKTVNFCIGYGGGKKKVVTTLSQTKELVAHLADDAKKILDESLEHCMDIYRQRHRELPRDAVIDRAVLQQDIFESLCWKRGETVYNTYHDRFPGVKIEMRMANETALSRGWVKTIDGRKRILPRQAAWRAFNSVCQGSAADIQKYITVRSAPRYNSDVRAFGVDLVCQVHDENLFHGDKDATRDPKLIKLIAEIMETPRRPLRVPLRVAAGWSDKDWRTASGKEGKIQVPR